MGADEVEVDEMGVHKVVVDEMRVDEMRVGKMGVDEMGVNEMGVVKVGVDEVEVDQKGSWRSGMTPSIWLYTERPWQNCSDKQACLSCPWCVKRTISYEASDDLSRLSRKPFFCICQNKGPDQLHSDSA